MLKRHPIGAIPLPLGDDKPERLASQGMKRMRDPDLRRSDWISGNRQPT